MAKYLVVGLMMKPNDAAIRWVMHATGKEPATQELRNHEVWRAMCRKERDFVAYGVNMHDTVVPFETWNIDEFLALHGVDKRIMWEAAYLLIKQHYKDYLEAVEKDSLYVSVVLHVLYNQVPAIMRFLRMMGDDMHWLQNMVWRLYESCAYKRGEAMHLGECLSQTLRIRNGDCM